MVRKKRKIKGRKIGEKTGQVVGAGAGAYVSGGTGAVAGSEVGRRVGGEVGEKGEEVVQKEIRVSPLSDPKGNPISPIQYEGMIKHIARDIYDAMTYRELENITDISTEPNSYVWANMSMDADKYITDTISEYLQGFITDELEQYYIKYTMYIEVLLYSTSYPTLFFKVTDGEGYDYIKDMAYQVIVKDVIKYLL